MTNEDYRNAVGELCDVSAGLSNWELEFISDMLEWQGEYTVDQKAVIDRIWGKVMS